MAPMKMEGAALQHSRLKQRERRRRTPHQTAALTTKKNTRFYLYQGLAQAPLRLAPDCFAKASVEKDRAMTTRSRPAFTKRA